MNTVTTAAPTQIKLTVTFLNKVLSFSFGNKVLRVTEGNSYVYYGATKKEANEKARKAFRFNGYKKSYEIVEAD